MPGPRRPPLRVWGWVVGAVVLAVVAALLWRGSDAAATSSTTAAPAEVPDGPPAGVLTEAWTAGGHPIPQALVQADRVLVGEAHGVRALDVLTGAEAWHYTRSNARLCGLTAVDDRAVAVFATADRCDEAVALDAGTGVRQWTRNLDLRPDIVLTSAPGMVLATAPTGVVVVDPGSNTLRWRADASAGCRIESGEVGSSAVVLLESCGVTARLRGLDRGDGAESWARELGGSGGVPPALAGAGRLVAVTAGDELWLFRGTDGVPLPPVALPSADGFPAGTGPDGRDDPPVAVAEAGDVLLVWARGTTSAIDGATGGPLWSVPARGLPAVSAGKVLAVPDPPVLVPEDGVLVARDPHTGSEIARSTVDGELPVGGRATTVGPVVVYRLPDRVIGYH